MVDVIYCFLLNHLAESIINPKIFLALISCVVAVMVLILVPPIAQDSSYHNFSDQKRLLGIPNFWNVVTNFPFLVIGIAGLIKIHKHNLQGMLPDLYKAYVAFFSGLILIGIGSGYYHLEPSNSTLVWDRMAMTVSFMSFLVLVVGESISTKTAAKLLKPLLFLGLASVIYWYLSENFGIGDLRFYGLVQFLPMLLIPLMLFLYDSQLSRKRWIFAIIIVYSLAKLVEIYDNKIFQWIGFSGHSLKHLFAAFSAYLFSKGLEVREPRN